MRDQALGLPIVLVILTALACVYACPARASLPSGDTCDPTARANSWTRAEKQRTRDRIAAACERVGGSPRYCAVWDAAVRRESWGGIAAAVCTKGVDADGDPEYGLGPLCLSEKWHAGKWPGDPNPDFCSPEASFMVAHAIARSAVVKYKAHNAVGIQAVFGGGRDSHRCYETGVPRWWRSIPILAWVEALIPSATECVVTPQIRHRRAVCSRMAECNKPITIDDLGDEVPLGQRRAWAVAAARAR